MDYVLKKHPDGSFQAFMALPGRGNLQSAATGVTRAEASVKAARQLYGKTAAAAKSAPAGPDKKAAVLKRRKAAVALAISKAAATPAIRAALRAGGLQAAELAASAIPGGAVVFKAIKIAQKFKPAARLLAKLIK